DRERGGPDRSPGPLQGWYAPHHVRDGSDRHRVRQGADAGTVSLRTCLERRRRDPGQPRRGGGDPCLLRGAGGPRRSLGFRHLPRRRGSGRMMTAAWAMFPGTGLPDVRLLGAAAALVLAIGLAIFAVA